MVNCGSQNSVAIVVLSSSVRAASTASDRIRSTADMESPEPTRQNEAIVFTERRRRSGVLGWVAPALVVAFLGLIYVDSEYDLGVLDASDSPVVAEAPAASQRNSPVSSPVSQPPSAGNANSSQPASTPSIDPDAGWVRGACVNEWEDGSVSLASCYSSHDGEILSTEMSDWSCPDSSTHSVELESGVACLLIYAASGFDADHCTFNGWPLKGDVYLADSGDAYDVMVSISEYTFLADLSVFAVENSFDATRCGLWHIVDNPWEADFVVAATEYDFLADFSIALVETEWEAGT